MEECKAGGGAMGRRISIIIMSRIMSGYQGLMKMRKVVKV